MGYIEHMVELYKDKAGPATVRSARFWAMVIRLANSPVYRLPTKAQRISMNYMLKSTRDAFLHKKPVVWTNLLFPSELLHGLDVINFYPEFAAVIAAQTGLSASFLQTADAAGYSQDLCSFHRAIIGGALQDYLPKPDFIVSSTHPCDSAPLSFSFLASHYDVPCYAIDVPTLTESEVDTEPTGRQLEEFAFVVAESLGISKKKVLEGTSRAIMLSNEARKYALEGERLREGAPRLLHGDEAMGDMSILVSAPGTKTCVDYYRSLLEYLRENYGNNFNKELDDGQRLLLWMHLKPYFKNDIAEYLKENDAVIVCEEYNYWHSSELDPGDPFISLAEKMTNHPLAGTSARRTEALKQLARNYNVDAAVHFNHRGCRQTCGCAQLVKDELASAGIKTLIIDGECIDENEHREGQIRTRLEAFFETL